MKPSITIRRGCDSIWTDHGHTADPEKIAKFEKNIGIALYNKAQWAKAKEYLEKVLERWQAPVPKPNLVGGWRLVRDLLVVLKTLYFPTRKLKPVSSERENEIFDLSYKVLIAMALPTTPGISFIVWHF